MRKGTWLSLILSVAFLLFGAGAVVFIRSEIPKQLSGKPLLAVSETRSEKPASRLKTSYMKPRSWS